MSCYDETIGGSSAYTVIPPIGGDQASFDMWVNNVANAFAASGWSVQQVPTMALLTMGANYFPSFQDASWDFSNLSPYWDLNGLTISGQALLVDGIVGLTIPQPIAPYYYFYVFPTAPTGVANRGFVFDKVIDYWAAAGGWIAYTQVSDPATGDLAALMLLTSQWQGQPTITTGLAINCNPTSGVSFGGGFICTSLGKNPISIYLTSGPGVANVVTNYIEIGSSIPMSPHPWTGGFIADDPFHQYGDKLGAPNKGKSSTNLTPFPASTEYTILVITPTSFFMHTQSDKDQPPDYWAIGTPLVAAPNTLDEVGIFCGRGTSAEPSLRTSFCCEPDNFFVNFSGNHNSDGDPAPYGTNPNLFITAFGRAQRRFVGVPLLWEGDGLNPGPGEISDPWAAINVMSTPNPIIGYLPDAFCTTDIIVSPDTTSAIDWDDQTWIPYTQNNTGQIGPSGTIFFRVDNINGSPWVPLKLRLTEVVSDGLSFADGQATVTFGAHGLIQINVTF